MLTAKPAALPYTYKPARNRGIFRRVYNKQGFIRIMIPLAEAHLEQVILIPAGGIVEILQFSIPQQTVAYFIKPIR